VFFQVFRDEKNATRDFRKPGIIRSREKKRIPTCTGGSPKNEIGEHEANDRRNELRISRIFCR
jgi:hypothetical protein